MNRNQQIFEEVTARFTASLEKNIVPWRQNWGFVELPKNYFSGHTYSGINSLIMLGTEYETPYFATFEQIEKAGGRVKSGSKADKVYFSKVLYYLNGQPIEFSNIKNLSVIDQNDVKRVFYWKYFCVFNMQYVKGIDIKQPAKIWEKNESIQECEFFLNSLNNKPNLKVKLSDTASYNKAKDLITMPKIQQFLSSEDYYATLFHELVHGTGHTSRLKRPTLMEVEKFGDKNYSKEELVAEIGSSFLCNFFGINTPVLDENQEAYVKGWLKALKEDVKLIFEAATEAQKAFNFLIGQEPIYSKNIQKSDE